MYGRENLSMLFLASFFSCFGNTPLTIAPAIMASRGCEPGVLSHPIEPKPQANSRYQGQASINPSEILGQPHGYGCSCQQRETKWDEKRDETGAEDAGYRKQKATTDGMPACLYLFPGHAAPFLCVESI